jgi:tetratricopeptide (TPR) repeat protein
VSVQQQEERTVNTSHSVRLRRYGALAAAILLAAACGRQEPPQAPEEAAEPAAAVTETAAAKVPVTTSSAAARALYDQGQALFDDLRFTEANQRFKEAVTEDPDLAMGHLMVAQTALTAAEFFDAVGKAKALSGSVSEGERLIIESLVAASENDQDTQLAALRNLVKAYPKDERTHARLAQFYIGQQDYNEAVKHFGHATQINPQFAPGYNALGYAYRNLGDFDNAKTAFEKYIELVPDEPNPYDSYAELLMESGDYDASIENYRKALQRDPAFGASYAGLATNYSLKGDRESALEASDDMLSVARNFAERQAAMFQAVLANVYAGDLEAAEAMCGTMLAEAEVRGNHAAMGNIHEYMGDMTLDAGDAAKAEEHYAEALEHRLQADINEANKEFARRAYTFKTALAAMVAGDKEAAAARTAEYKAAAEVQGTTFEKRRIHELEGFLAMLNEDYAGTAEHLGQADQTNPVVLYWAAEAHRELGDVDAARALAERAANRNTLSPLLPLVRGEALELRADLDAA